MSSQHWFLVGIISYILIGQCVACLLPVEIAEWAIKEFQEQQKRLPPAPGRGHDRRHSLPFISGDGFRAFCQHICEDANRCRMDPEKVQNGEAVFVKSDFMDFFANHVTKRINATYLVVSHNGDLSSPDGQTDAPSIRMPQYIGSAALKEEYQSGKLLSFHGQNLWWRNVTIGEPRPSFMHCLPIGFENRQYPIGRVVNKYLDALQSFVINSTYKHLKDEDRPLLLIAFYPKSRVPDRGKVLNYLGAYRKRQGNEEPRWYNHTDLNHWQWLEAITLHKFVLAPFGHGLDTHRISEILLMGGIPVMKRSTISSCYDDSDNLFNGKTRGSLPVVILDKWEDLTKERLEQEWIRIKKIPKTQWDWSRLFIYHWVERIFGKIPTVILH